MVEQVIHAGETVEQVVVDTALLDVRYVQEAGSTLRLHVLSFSSASNTIEVEHVGEGCRTEIYALAYIGGKDCVRTHTHVHHNIGNGSSEQIVKFVLRDQAEGEFFGELKIAQDAQHTEALQTNRNLLLSEQATMRTRPQLEIYADDVKASHGATTGQLDESALFYMQQRGLSPEQGRQLLLQAFMADIINTISDEAQRDALMQKIELL